MVNYQKIKILLPRYYQKLANIKVDTDKFKNEQIEKEYQRAMVIQSSGKSVKQWKKDYHNLLWKADKKNQYSNEILTY